MFKHQGFSAVALVIILAVLALGGYAVWKKQAVVSAPPTDGSPTSITAPTLPADTNIEPPTTSDLSDNQAGWKTYKNEKYRFEVKYPTDWIVVEKYQPSDAPLINIIKQNDNGGEAFAPFRYPTYRGSARTANYISNFSIYPTGYPSEPPNWESVPRSITLHESVKYSSDFILEDGRPFITGISFTNPPVTWDEFGFVSIGLPVTFLEQKCIFDGNELPLDHCDIYEPRLPTGILKTYGTIDEEDRPVLNQILSTFRFTK